MEDSVNKKNYSAKENTRDYVTKINSMSANKSFNRDVSKTPSTGQDSSLTSSGSTMPTVLPTYLKEIYVEPGVMNKNQANRLNCILLKYQKVFDGDISEGYNNASGAFDVDWNWLNGQKPPPGVSRQEVYSNEEMNKVKQEKID